MCMYVAQRLDVRVCCPYELINHGNHVSRVTAGDPPRLYGASRLYSIDPVAAGKSTF